MTWISPSGLCVSISSHFFFLLWILTLLSGVWDDGPSTRQEVLFKMFDRSEVFWPCLKVQFIRIQKLVLRTTLCYASPSKHSFHLDPLHLLFTTITDPLPKVRWKWTLDIDFLWYRTNRWRGNLFLQNIYEIYIYGFRREFEYPHWYQFNFIPIYNFSSFSTL